MSNRTALAFLAAFLAASCSDNAGAPSREQNREMENAAEMLDQAPARLSEIDDRELLEGGANQAGTAGEAPRQ